MKKITIAITLGLLGIMISTASASAASSFQFSPTSVDTNPGKTFTLKVTLDPQGVKNYTSKLEIDFPADILKVNSFTFGDGWLPLSMSGYDLIDNTNGIMIKSAGYPGGISSPVTFGTVSFTTKKEGSGTITITGNSLVFNAASQNVLSSTLVRVSVIVKTAVATPTTPTTPSGQEVQEEEIIQKTEEIATQEQKETTPENPFLARLDAVFQKIANIWLLLVMVIIIGLGYGAFYFFKKFKIIRR